MKRRKTFVLYAIMTGYLPRLMMKMDTVPMRSALAADFSQFGLDDYPDKDKGITEWRKKWEANGRPWFSKVRKATK